MGGRGGRGHIQGNTVMFGSRMLREESKRSGLILDTSESRADWTYCRLEAYKAIQACDKK